MWVREGSFDDEPPGRQQSSPALGGVCAKLMPAAYRELYILCDLESPVPGSKQPPRQSLECVARAQQPGDLLLGCVMCSQRCDRSALSAAGGGNRRKKVASQGWAVVPVWFSELV